MVPRRAQLVAVLVLVMVAVYLGAYIALSRTGYADADRLGVEGFYYCTADGLPTRDRAHVICSVVFWPVNAVDRLLGFGRAPAALPLRNLE